MKISEANCMLDKRNLDGFVLGLQYHRSHQKLRDSINTKNKKVSSLFTAHHLNQKRLWEDRRKQQSTLYTYLSSPRYLAMSDFTQAINQLRANAGF